MLELRQLQVNYGKSRAVNGVSLSLPEGGRLSVLGRNGVGKTTMLKAVIGLLPAAGGKILLDGRDISRLPAHERSRLGIAYVPQGREILPELTVLENLQLGCIGCRDRALVAGRTGRTLGYFPALREHLGRMGGLLSGGQQQQLAIARALMTSPRYLLLDEPTEGIQPNVVEELGETLHRICAETNLAFLLVEQNLDFALRMTDHFAILQKGSVVSAGETADLDSSAAKQWLSV